MLGVRVCRRGTKLAFYICIHQWEGHEDSEISVANTNVQEQAEIKEVVLGGLEEH